MPRDIFKALHILRTVPNNLILPSPPFSLLTLQLLFAFALDLLLTKFPILGLLFIPAMEILEGAKYKLLQQDDGDGFDGGSDDEGARCDPREWRGDVAFDRFNKESTRGFGKFDRVILGDVLDDCCEDACRVADVGLWFEIMGGCHGESRLGLYYRNDDK